MPLKEGLYDPSLEKDSCGVGFIAKATGEKSHKIITDAITILKNLQHRGAAGMDPKAGDGAGILSQLPDAFFQKVAKDIEIDLPPLGEYGVGMVFMPKNEKQQGHCREIIYRIIQQEKQELLGWRKVPTENACLSHNMLEMEPEIYQFFIRKHTFSVDAFERKLYVIRRLIEKTVAEDKFVSDQDFFNICSLSSATIVYKGMLMADQLDAYFPDLLDQDFTSALATVHQRYSTNTFPTWGLAQPFRYIAHNGEINTLQGNINWCRSRENLFESDLFREDIKKLLPIIVPGGSDSATFDNFYELLVASGKSPEHAIMMMIPEAWENDTNMNPELRGFYEYYGALLEPWDGPADIVFTDGTKIGGALDRNGLRPARIVITDDDLVVMASEVGVLDIPIEKIKFKTRLGPGKVFLVDTANEKILFDEEIKQSVSTQKSYLQWVQDAKIHLKDLPTPPSFSQPDHMTLRTRQRTFGYTYEELTLLIKPMAISGNETIYSMGTDTPLAVLSQKSKLLYAYFKQQFAQVTNPPIDPIREKLVMSLISNIGGEYNLLEENPQHVHMLELSHPILTNLELEQLRNIQSKTFRSLTLDMSFPVEEGEKGMEKALEKLCANAEEAVKEGYRLIVLSDRNISEKIAPIPALLATSAVHHHLIRQNNRGKIGLIVESGEVREVHHFAILIAYGAGAINPYLAFESITEMYINGELAAEVDAYDRDVEEASLNYVKAIKKGLLKIFSKMGISTLSSYQGAQIFEAVGLNSSLIDKYFCGTKSAIQGIGIDVIAKEVLMRHELSWAPQMANIHRLRAGGEYNWRTQGEYHAYNPETISTLQECTRNNSYEQYKKFSHLINVQDQNLFTLRGLFEFAFEKATPIPLEDVEPIEHIVSRFCTGAMSMGSISREAHETLAIAMNRLKGKSNTGEGGEDAERFIPDANGDLRRSAIKQIASGRFGVTSHYLVNADELQIKMAQGAKPGEGGQLPGHKVDEYIGSVRHTVPGVSLISPPPHHDIYSIEDLAQLIYDLKNSNPNADVSVKLVSEIGVGTVAAGVSKAHADLVLISGHDGGTGASPATSIKYAGSPWEIGLAETQQTLVKNNLRGQIKVQTDGQLKTGRDVMIAALLGAETFGFATAPLIVSGCLMMRKCHLNTCPVGIATQNETLRKNYQGKPEYLVNYFTFLAKEVREIMAQLGFRKMDDLIGQVEFLRTQKAIKHWKAEGLDLSPLFVKPVSKEGAYRCVRKQNHYLEKALDNELILKAKLALEHGKQVHFTSSIRNIHRTAGTMLGSEVSKRYGAEGLPEDTIRIDFTGTAGQSFGAFLPKGITLKIDGDANDYVGKGLSGGKIIIAPPKEASWNRRENMIVGNTVLYGATSGQVFFSGLAGERFAVRNSGARAVVEGVGDHGCEYMTGGEVVVLGETGRNFAAGMSGGIAYIYDKERNFKKKCNLEMVNLERIIDSERIDSLFELITLHFNYTQSPIANKILSNWEKNRADFVMVIPREYRRILAKIRKNKVAISR